MIITRIEPINKKKSKIYIDGQLAFALYKGELSRYGIRVDKELAEEDYKEIVDVVLTKRAKLYCMNLLQSMDRTEMQLIRKLKEKSYPEEVVDAAVAYVKKYGYVDDVSYTNRYIDCKSAKQSKQQIVMDLLKKGISKQVINEVYEEKEPVDEEAMIKRWIEKKRIDIASATTAEKQKLYMFLMRKGFSSSDVNRVMREMDICLTR